jgi:glutathione S-transferase
MLELIQFPWSPYCIVQRRILEASGVKFKIINIPNGDRSLVWKVTRERYYQVPVLKDGPEVVFETGADSQVIAKYLDQKLELGLFPKPWEGVQDILWRYFENEVEGVGFRLNDIYWEEMVSPKDRLLFLRHKERKFGRGCIDQWRGAQSELLQELEQKLVPCEEMLLTRDFLLESRPIFVDFNLYGMLGNFLYSGHYKLPRAHTKLAAWYGRMTTIKLKAREKLHT